MIDAMKQAQVELERIRDAMLRNVSASYTNLDAAIAALRTAIESAEKAEPAAWIYRGGADVPPCDDGFHPWRLSVGPDRPHLAWRHQELRPLYTHPPAAPAITDSMVEQAARVIAAHDEYESSEETFRRFVLPVARAALEAALKEK